MSTIYLSQYETHLLFNQISSAVYPLTKRYRSVVGIERGGVYLSYWLSYIYNLSHETIKITRRHGESVTDLGNLSRISNREPFLLVDDIVDSGLTIQTFKKATGLVQNRDFIVISLHWCPENSNGEYPNHYAATKRKVDWIVYHWEQRG